MRIVRDSDTKADAKVSDSVERRGAKQEEA